MSLNRVFVPDVVSGEACDVRREPDVRPDGMLSALEVVKGARITYRQLDYWCRSGIIDPRFNGSGSGVGRLFTIAQAQVAAAVGRLVEAGVSLDLARRIAPELSEGASTIGLAPGLDLVLGSGVYALKRWAVEE